MPSLWRAVMPQPAHKPGPSELPVEATGVLPSSATLAGGILTLCLVLLGLVACSQPPTTPSAPALVRLSGSTAMQSLLHDLAAAYSGLQPHVSFDFSAVGSTAGLEELRRGNADLALVARRLQPEEEYDAESRKRLLSYTVIAHDGIAVIVNASNPVGGLSLYDIRNIFEGRVERWDVVGGAPEDIVVISREEGSGTRSVFEELVMYGRRTTPTGLIMPGSNAVRNYVATHPEAIGYLSMGLLDSGVAALAVDLEQPNRGTVENGTYWIARPFLLVSQPEPNSEVAGFMQFARSPAGQVIVQRLYGDARAGG